MTVGNQPTTATINGMLSNAAVQLRNTCDMIRNMQTYVVALGLTGLEAIGFSAADAQTVLNDFSYLATVSGVYYGTATQGTQFDFDNQLAPLWGGQ